MTEAENQTQELNYRKKKTNNLKKKTELKTKVEKNLQLVHDKKYNGSYQKIEIAKQEKLPTRVVYLLK